MPWHIDEFYVDYELRLSGLKVILGKYNDVRGLG
jgi:hypothetical protein